MAGVDKFISVNGVRLHYVEHGDPGNPPFICLHGITMEGHSWDPFASQISDRYHVLALTARGHGDSDRAESYEGQMYVEDTAAFVEATGSAPAIVCGLSMGSMVGLGLAALHADKVAKLIAVDGGPRSGPGGSKRIGEALTMHPAVADSIEEAMAASRVGFPGAPEAELRRLIEHNSVRGEDGKVRWKVDPKIVQAREDSPRGEGSPDEMENLLWMACGMVQCPTLIVRGAHSDILERETAERMAQTIPNAQLVEVDAGHAVPHENPDGFCEAVKGFI